VRGASALGKAVGETPGHYRVIVVWEPVLATDLGPPTAAVRRTLDDPRVRQFWDPDRAVSSAMIRAWHLEDDVVWDVVQVHPPGTRWSARPRPAWSDGPVVRTVRELKRRLR